jgi:hypothetical protein
MAAGMDERMLKWAVVAIHRLQHKLRIAGFKSAA